MATHPLFERQLPRGWHLQSVDEVKANEPSSCVAGPFGSNISSKYFVDDGVPVIRGSNLRDDLTQFVPEGFVFVSEDRAHSYLPQHVHGGDLVFTCWGTIGQVGLIPKDGPYPAYIISNKQLKLRPNLAITDPRYLFYYFASPQMVQYLKGRAIGAAVPGINLGILKALPVVLPPLPVQRRIADVLSAYDDLIENNTKRIKILEEMARSLYREWFMDLRFPGHSSTKFIPSTTGKAPQGWDLGRLDDILVLQRGFDLPIGSRRAGAVPVFAATGQVGTHDEAKVPGPGVLTGRSGSLGTVNLVLEDFWPLNTALWVKEFRWGGPFFAYYLLSSLELRGLDGGAAVPTLNRNDVHALKVLKPPRDLVQRFESLVEPLLRQRDLLSRHTTILRTTRDLLLPRLLSGEIELHP